jgi:hypothetical protein
MRKLSKFMGGGGGGGGAKDDAKEPPAHEHGNREWSGLSTQDRLKQASLGRAQAVWIARDGVGADDAGWCRR